MTYTEITINNEIYKLRLNTRNTVALEKALGYNPIDILLQMDRNEVPKVQELVMVLHYALQQYNHNINLDKAYDIFDDYLAEDHTIFDFINDVVVPVYQNCGLLSSKSEATDEEKN